jgi:hypothetical protein
MYGGSHTLVYIGGCLRGSSVMKKQPLESIVFVIDDDASIRACLKSLFESVGFRVRPTARVDGLADSRVIVNDKHNRLGDGWVLHE